MGVRKQIMRLALFTGSNLLGTAVDMLVLWICSHFLFEGSYFGEYLLSPFISFECSLATNFLVNRNITWRGRTRGHTLNSLFRLYLMYNLSCTGVFLFKMLILLGIERISGWDVLVCNLLALCVSGGINFLIGDRVIFKNRNKTKN